MRKLHRVIATSLAVCLIVVTPVQGQTASSKLQEAQQNKAQAESGKENAQKKLSALNGEEASLRQYLEQLDEELTKVSMRVNEIEGLMEEKQEELDQMQQRLKDAKEAQLEQYYNMKKRIQFMYEKGNDTYMTLMLSAEGFGDMLNKNAYFTKLTEYDRKMLQNYVELQEQIKNDEADMGDAKEALTVLQLEASEQSAQLMEVVKKVGDNIKDYQEQIASQEKQMKEYEEQIAAENNNIEEAKKEMAMQEKLAGTSIMRDLSGLSVSASDLDMLAAIIECEAGGEPYVGKVAVGAVVLNRLRSSRFPNTIMGVLYQKRQFSPVGSGRFAVVLARGANATCYQAAQDALAGQSPVGEKLFFRTPIPGLTGQQIGGHIFYG